jgi:exosortase H (IPTLxxWG-CTERM-specific)
VTVLLWAAVLSFPATWRQRAAGLAAGGAAIHGVNVIRIISLFYLGQWNMSVFEFAHMYLWESLIMIDALVVFWTWAWLVKKPGAIPQAHAG